MHLNKLVYFSRSRFISLRLSLLSLNFHFPGYNVGVNTDSLFVLRVRLSSLIAGTRYGLGVISRLALIPATWLVCFIGFNNLWHDFTFLCALSTFGQGRLASLSTLIHERTHDSIFFAFHSGPWIRQFFASFVRVSLFMRNVKLFSDWSTLARLVVFRTTSNTSLAYISKKELKELKCMFAFCRYVLQWGIEEACYWHSVLLVTGFFVGRGFIMHSRYPESTSLLQKNESSSYFFLWWLSSATELLNLKIK